MIPNKDGISDLVNCQFNKEDELLNNYLSDCLAYSTDISNSDSFLVYSTDFDEDVVKIINDNFMEFSELVYAQHYLLNTKKEINRNVGVYLMPLECDCDLNETLKVIDNLINRKRTITDNLLPLSRNVPHEHVSKGMIDLKMEIEQISEKMNLMNEIGIVLAEKMTKMDQQFHEMRNMVIEKTAKKTPPQTLKNLEQKSTLEPEIELFYKQTNLNYIRESPELLDKICERLSVIIAEDDTKYEPPLANITSIEDKRREMIAYFDLLQKNLDGSTEESETQKSIRDWMASNLYRFNYKPSADKRNGLDMEIEKQTGLKNVVGTLCFLAYNSSERFRFIGIIVIKNKIVYCTSGPTSTEAIIQAIHEYLKFGLNWDINAKLATDMDISDNLSDYFVQVTKDDYKQLTDNNRVVNWMKNNFKCLNYCMKEQHHLSIPVIHNICLEYLEESFRQK